MGNANQLDDLDFAILEYLSRDGRMSFSEIARELGVSHTTIHKRYDKMKENNGLKIASWIEPHQVGLMANAILRMIVETQYVEEAATALSELPEVIWVARLTGEFNLMADLTCVSMDHLRRLLEERITEIKGIRQTDLAIYLRYYKSDVVPNVKLLRQIAQLEEREAQD